MKHWTTLLLLPLLCAACSKNTDEAADPATRSIEVAIGSGPRLDIRPQSTTRTELGDDGVSVKWQTGDRLALWAVNSAAQTVVDAVAFSLYHYNATYNSANFRGSIPQMAEDTYTYYAVSPVPASTDGLRASYDIPAVQDGTFHGEWDVMVATPIEGADALREHDKKDPSGISDNTDIVNLQFAHKMHVLKITIPRNDLGEPISEIKLTFPTPVVGRLTVDAANPAAAAELSESSNTLTLRFSEPKEAEDVVYALIAPVTLEEGQEVSIVASSSGLESEVQTFAPADRTFAAGHTTPIDYNVPAAAVQLTQLVFTLTETGVNTLGEAINTFTVTAPEGWSFEDGSQSHTFDVTGTGDYTVRFRGYTNPTEEMPGFQVTYDSEHALLTEEFTLPAVSVGGETAVEFRVPYLLEEDFSGATYKSYARSAEELSAYGLPGWGASCCGLESERASFYMYVGTSTSGINNHLGRIDTPFLPLKEGVSVPIRVSYDIGAPEVSGTLSSKWSLTCQFGLQNDTEGGIDGETEMSRVVEQYTPTSGGGFTGSLPQSVNGLVIPDVGARTRLTWRTSDYQRVSGSRWSVLTNVTFYVYLDNIRVSIAQ